MGICCAWRFSHGHVYFSSLFTAVSPLPVLERVIHDGLECGHVSPDLKRGRESVAGLCLAARRRRAKGCRLCNRNAGDVEKRRVARRRRRPGQGREKLRAAQWNRPCPKSAARQRRASVVTGTKPAVGAYQGRLPDMERESVAFRRGARHAVRDVVAGLVVGGAGERGRSGRRAWGVTPPAGRARTG